MAGRYPRPPHEHAPAALAEHGRKISRLEGSRDQTVSALSQHAAQIATVLADIATILTRLNGANNFSFLAALGSMSHIANATDSFAHSGVGTLSNPPTASEFNALNTAFNNLVDGVNTLVNNKFNALLAELQNSGYMS